MAKYHAWSLCEDLFTTAQISKATGISSRKLKNTLQLSDWSRIIQSNKGIHRISEFQYSFWDASTIVIQSTKCRWTVRDLAEINQAYDELEDLIPEESFYTRPKTRAELSKQISDVLSETYTSGLVTRRLSVHILSEVVSSLFFCLDGFVQQEGSGGSSAFSLSCRNALNGLLDDDQRRRDNPNLKVV